MVRAFHWQYGDILLAIYFFVFTYYFVLSLKNKYTILLCTLLKIIKGTHVMNGIADLASMLHFMQDMCLLGNCLSNIKSHGWMIVRVKIMPLDVGEHPHPYIRIGW